MKKLLSVMIMMAMLFVLMAPVNASPPNRDVWNAEWVGNAPNRNPDGLVTRTFRVTPAHWAAGVPNTGAGLITTTGAVTIGVTPLHRLPTGVSSAPPSTPLGVSINEAGVLSGPITITLIISEGYDAIGAMPPEDAQWYVAVDIGASVPNVGPAPNHSSHVHLHLPRTGNIVNEADGGGSSSGCNAGFGSILLLLTGFALWRINGKKD